MMSYKYSLAGFVDSIAKRRQLVKLPKKLSARFEAAAAEMFFDSKSTVIIETEESNFPIVANLINTKNKYSLALGCDEDQVENVFSRAVAEARRPREEDGEFLKNSTSKGLDILPIVTHFEKDAGAYVTSSIVVALNKETKTQNISVHRLLKLGEDRMAIRMVEGRHLHRAFTLAKEAGEDLHVAVVIGVHPAVEIAASYQAPYGFDELYLANSLMQGRLGITKLNNGLHVPSCSEIVLTGKILADEVADDYMVEMLGNYDIPRKQPVLQVERIYYKDKAYFRDILPGGREHRLLMSYAVELKVAKAVRDVVPSTKKVVFTDGGRNWLHAVIQMKKRLEGEPKNAILAAFGAHPSLKHVVVVDEDINPEDPQSVEYAIATRFQAGRGIVMIRDAKGSSLDPSSDQSLLLTDKLGIDATASVLKDRSRFELGRIPGYEKVVEEIKKL